MNKIGESEVLKGALALLVKHEVLTLEEIGRALNNGGFYSLWHLINRKNFQDIKNK